jgi:soluble lytic murein transglycosylase-like protein
MSYALRIRRFASRAVTLTFHCLHGSFLTTGVLVVIALAAIISDGKIKHESAAYHFREWSIAAGLASPTATDLEAVEDDAETPTNLSRRMQAVVDYVARRYRVSGLAVMPLIKAAEESADSVGLDPLLVVAVIGVESGFNPYSESVVGAQGLMQVIGKYHADKLGPDADKSALLNPETNIQVGVRVLKESIRRAGNVTSGLQQYAGAVDDADQVYASKVFAERQRLEQAVRKARAEGV